VRTQSRFDTDLLNEKLILKRGDDALDIALDIALCLFDHENLFTAFGEPHRRWEAMQLSAT